MCSTKLVFTTFAVVLVLIIVEIFVVSVWSPIVELRTKVTYFRTVK